MKFRASAAVELSLVIAASVRFVPEIVARPEVPNVSVAVAL